MLIPAHSGSAVAAPRSADATSRLALGLLLLLLLALQFGPVIGLLGLRLTGDVSWVFNGALRDALVLLLVVLALWARLGAGRTGQGGPLPPSARWALLLVLVLVLMALASPSQGLVTALNLRRLALVPLLVLALLWLPWRAAQLDLALRLIVASSVVVALLGIAERLAPVQLWTDWLEIEAYTAANGFDKFGSLAHADSGRFHSWDLEPWTGTPWRRMVATYLEPTTLAAAMAALLCLALARRARGHPCGWPLALALVCGLATLSKGFVLFLLALGLWRLLGVPSPRQLLALAAAGCAGALAVASSQLDGTLAHVAGLATALQQLAQGDWLGQGIGSAGNYNNDGAEVGDESGLGNAIAQVGLAGLLPLLWVAAMARDVLATAAARRDPGGPWLAAWLLFWMLSFLFSASSLGVGGNALGFAALALYLHPAAALRRSNC